MFSFVKKKLQLCQKASNFTEFKQLVSLMLLELGNDYEQFKEYFVPQYVTGPLAVWYEGHDGFVATNNGLEATNQVIKKENTNRVLHTVASFLPIMAEIVNDWSFHSHRFATVPTIPDSIYTTGYQLSLQFDKVFEMINDNEWLFYNRKVTVIDTVVNDRRFSQFSSLGSFRCALKYVHLLKVEHLVITCSCELGICRLPCAHKIALSHSLPGYPKIPGKFHSVPFVLRGHAGKQPKVAAALVYQDSPERPHQELWNVPSDPVPVREPKKRGRPPKRTRNGRRGRRG